MIYEQFSDEKEEEVDGLRVMTTYLSMVEFIEIKTWTKIRGLLRSEADRSIFIG